MHRSILVTGASGFAGTHLLAHLTRTRLESRTTDTTTSIEAWSRPHGQAARPIESVGWNAIDVLDAGAVDAAIAGSQPSEIYHLAGAANVGASWLRSSEQLRTHVLGTHHVLRSVRRHVPACRVLVVSSGMIYRPQPQPVDEFAGLGPVSPYGLSKLAEDQLAQHAASHDQLDVVIARPFNHIGPGQSPDFAASSFALQIAEIELGRRAPVIAVGNLEAARDLTDVRDVVAAYAALMQRGTTATSYNICSGSAVSMHTVLQQLLTLSPAHVTITLDESRLRPSDVPYLAGNAARLIADTGWRPQTPLVETLRDLLDHWRAALRQAN